MNLSSFVSLLARAPRGQVVWLGALTLLSSLTDGIGLLLLVPLLDILTNAASADTGSSYSSFLRRIFATVGLPLNLSSILLIYVAAIMCRTILVMTRDRVSLHLQNRVVDSLREECFSALLASEWRWITLKRQSDHINLLVTDIGRIGVGLQYALNMVTGLGALLAYIGAAFLISPLMTLLVTIIGVLVAVALKWQRQSATAFGQDLSTASKNFQRVIQQSLTSLKLTKILGNSDRHRQTMISVMRDLRMQYERYSHSRAVVNAWYQVGGAVLLAAFMYVGIEMLSVPVAGFLVLVLIFSRLLPQFSGLQQNYYNWLHAVPVWEETKRLLAECRAAAEPEAGPVDHDFGNIVDGIRLTGVVIQYAGRDHPALDDIDLFFKARTTTAIVGSSGSGKTTLADVIMGLLEPDAGRLTVDDRLIAGADRIAWRRSVAYVPQEVHLFNESIRSNLEWAAPEASDEDVRRALSLAAAEFVFDLPDGIDTKVGDGGVNFSGGERQRIALARALLRRPALLILDEATSALDKTNELKIRQSIERLHGDLTVILIGHRLATLEHADNVIVLDQGRVQAVGDWTSVASAVSH